jgi:hypothetical protein
VGRRQHISFYGDIIGRVFTRPHQNGYEWVWHPAARLGEHALQVGPVIAPVRGKDGSKRKMGKDGVEARGDLYLKFIELEPKLSNFRLFADAYGLLGVTSLPLPDRDGDARTSEPLVLWLQHYFRLRLISGILLSGSQFDRLRFFDNQMDMGDRLADCLNSALQRLAPTVEANGPREQYRGADLGSGFETIWPHFPVALNDLALRNEAYRALTDQLGQHCRIVVRSRGKRQNFDLPEGFGDWGRDVRLITTSLEPKGLLGAMYIGILLRLSGGSFNARASTGCQHCGAPVPDPKSNKKYCGDSCKQKAKRLRGKMKGQTMEKSNG